MAASKISVSGGIVLSALQETRHPVTFQQLLDMIEAMMLVPAERIKLSLKFMLNVAVRNGFIRREGQRYRLWPDVRDQGLDKAVKALNRARVAKMPLGRPTYKVARQAIQSPNKKKRCESGKKTKGKRVAKKA